MKVTGGYFELELNRGSEYHKRTIRLNLGRTAFEYIIRARKIHKVFLPYYTCNIMLEPITKTGVDFEFYHIDENLEPVFNYASLSATDFFLYTNYFGLKDRFIVKLAKIIKNLIIDNSQAFFSNPKPGIDTFYSPRKFFGVPDGGYLYTSKILTESLETDNSSDRFEHLIGRIENRVEKFYPKFMENEQKLSDQPIKQMSKITQQLLQSIDYAQVAEIRKRNFRYLHEKLSGRNILNFEMQSESVPMIYPFLSDKKDLREHLIRNKIFVAHYWPNVTDWCTEDNLEYNFARTLIPLPIDQRYGIKEMETIISLIQKYFQ